MRYVNKMEAPINIRFIRDDKKYNQGPGTYILNTFEDADFNYTHFDIYQKLTCFHCRRLDHHIYEIENFLTDDLYLHFPPVELNLHDFTQLINNWPELFREYLWGDLKITTRSAFWPYKITIQRLFKKFHVTINIAKNKFHEKLYIDIKKIVNDFQSNPLCMKMISIIPNVPTKKNYVKFSDVYESKYTYRIDELNFFHYE